MGARGLDDGDDMSVSICGCWFLLFAGHVGAASMPLVLVGGRASPVPHDAPRFVAARGGAGVGRLPSFFYGGPFQAGGAILALDCFRHLLLPSTWTWSWAQGPRRFAHCSLLGAKMVLSPSHGACIQVSWGKEAAPCFLESRALAFMAMPAIKPCRTNAVCHRRPASRHGHRLDGRRVHGPRRPVSRRFFQWGWALGILLLVVENGARSPLGKTFGATLIGWACGERIAFGVAKERACLTLP